MTPSPGKGRRRPTLKLFLIRTLLVFNFFLGCATAISREQRVIESVTEVNLTKDQIFDRSLDFLAKRINNSNYAVQVKDKERGKIISKLITRCQSLTEWYTMAGDYFELDLNLELIAKDKKYKLRFDDLDLYVVRIQNGNSKDRSYGFSEETLKEVEFKCIDPFRTDLQKAINAKADDF